MKRAGVKVVILHFKFRFSTKLQPITVVVNHPFRFLPTFFVQLYFQKTWSSIQCGLLNLRNVSETFRLTLYFSTNYFRYCSPSPARTTIGSYVKGYSAAPLLPSLGRRIFFIEITMTSFPFFWLGVPTWS